MISIQQKIARKSRRLEEAKLRFQKQQAEITALEKELEKMNDQRDENWRQNLLKALRREGRTYDFAALPVERCVSALVRELEQMEMGEETGEEIKTEETATTTEPADETKPAETEPDASAEETAERAEDTEPADDAPAETGTEEAPKEEPAPEPEEPEEDDEPMDLWKAPESV